MKRKNGENRDREYSKEINKDVKKQKKFHEVDTSYMRNERMKNILKNYSRTCPNKTDKRENRSQQQLMVGLWEDKGCSPSIVVSPKKFETERTKEETYNKVVPPLRLKKVVRKGETFILSFIRYSTISYRLLINKIKYVMMMIII